MCFVGRTEDDSDVEWTIIHDKFNYSQRASSRGWADRADDGRVSRMQDRRDRTPYGSRVRRSSHPGIGVCLEFFELALPDAMSSYEDER